MSGLAISMTTLKKIWDFIQMLRGRKRPPKRKPTDPFEIAVEYKNANRK